MGEDGYFERNVTDDKEIQGKVEYNGLREEMNEKKVVSFNIENEKLASYREFLDNRKNPVSFN
jgi:hypothetical protein